MEGRVSCGFEHANYNLLAKSKSPLLLFRSTPPFSAINKFLEIAHDNNNNNSPQNIYQKNNPNKTINTTTTTSTTMEDFGDFSSSSSTNTLHRVNCGCVNLSPNDTTMHGNNFVEGLFLDGNESQNSEISHEVVPRNEEINSLLSNVKGSKERNSKGFNDMIKGQWTEEEDRLLKTLVLKYGERKWAMIARSHLVGRAGKQCRERWHNHLRPDIKKDAWDEEEERMLVSAHQQFGNKWAEIARRIPGRSENSIKNHWNATKRRQNSRRKNKNKIDIQYDEPLNQPSILQEYIKTMSPCNNNTNQTLQNPSIVGITMTGSEMSHQMAHLTTLTIIPTSTTTATTTIAATLEAAMSPSSTSTNVSGDPPSHIDHYHLLEPSCDEYYFESPTSLTIVANPCHDEVLFMQQLFREENNHNNYNNNPYYYNFDDEIVDSKIDHHNNIHNNDHYHDDQQIMGEGNHLMMIPQENSDNMNINNNSSTCFYSDKFLANLLEGRSYNIDQQEGSGGMMSNFQPYDQLDQRPDMMEDINQGYLSTQKKDMDLYEMILSPQFSSQSSSNSRY